MRFIITRTRIVEETCVVRAQSKKQALVKARRHEFLEWSWESDCSDEIIGPELSDVRRDD